MIIGVRTFDLRIAQAHSLKEKRRVLKSLLERAGGRFNASLAELEHHDLHQRALIGAAVLSNEKSHAGEMLDRIGRFIESEPEVEITAVYTEIY
ncbi:MAG: DUF503 domain-containing protein [Clostridiales bacterium]|nr:DUF503 domain-containing protein [Clostridiales bacterium]